MTYSHFLLEAQFAGFIKVSICALAGIYPLMLFVRPLIDGLWGNFIHVGEDAIKDDRFRFLGKVILTPSHHRAHHARNPLYIDTNFCNLLNIWDRVFKTYQPENKKIKFEYGITREMKKNSFLDAYLGEFYYLWKDLVSAPGLKNKLGYIFMPPGWHHSGNHKTASTIRSEYLARS